MPPATEEIDALTERIIGCGIEVHRLLGPGLLESVYRVCLTLELKDHGLLVKIAHPDHLGYKGRRLRSELKVDLLIEGKVVVELKSIERFHPVHLAQVITYLKLTMSSWSPDELQCDLASGRVETTPSSGPLFAGATFSRKPMIVGPNSLIS
jgi:GxxExxY protein